MIYLSLSAIFILGVAFFSGIETGLVSILRPRVQYGMSQNERRAGILNFFLKHPGYMLATTLIGTNVCHVCSSVMLKEATDSFGFTGGDVILFLTIFLTVVLLHMEIISKDWFRQQPYQRCLIFARLLYASYFILYVPVRIMASFTGFINRVSGKKLTDERSARTLMREDFVLFLRDSESSGLIDSSAAEILESSLDFNLLTAGEIMRKREDVREIGLAASISEAIEISRTKGVSRMPVSNAQEADPGAGEWVGVFSVYDAFLSVPEGEWGKRKVGEIMRPLVSVQDRSPLDEILFKAKKNRSPLMAVKSSSDSKFMGIVTPNDVVKRLFE